MNTTLDTYTQPEQTDNNLPKGSSIIQLAIWGALSYIAVFMTVEMLEFGYYFAFEENLLMIPMEYRLFFAGELGYTANFLPIQTGLYALFIGVVSGFLIERPSHKQLQLMLVSGLSMGTVFYLYTSWQMQMVPPLFQSGLVPPAGASMGIQPISIGPAYGFYSVGLVTGGIVGLLMGLIVFRRFALSLGLALVGAIGFSLYFIAPMQLLVIGNLQNSILTTNMSTFWASFIYQLLWAVIGGAIMGGGFAGLMNRHLLSQEQPITE